MFYHNLREYKKYWPVTLLSFEHLLQRENIYVKENIFQKYLNKKYFSKIFICLVKVTVN